LLVTLWLLINTIMTEPVQSFIGIGLIILGLPVYYYFSKRRKAFSPEDDGEIE
jgi:hypothetical protein